MGIIIIIIAHTAIDDDDDCWQNTIDPILQFAFVYVCVYKELVYIYFSCN